jgi:cytochrome c
MVNIVLNPLSILISSLLLAGTSSAIEIATPQMGRQLFESPLLGTQHRSCASCHPNGKGLEKISDFSDSELKDIINACIRDAQRGTPFAIDSQELDALLQHVRTLRNKP